MSKKNLSGISFLKKSISISLICLKWILNSETTGNPLSWTCQFSHRFIPSPHSPAQKKPSHKPTPNELSTSFFPNQKNAPVFQNLPPHPFKRKNHWPLLLSIWSWKKRGRLPFFNQPSTLRCFASVSPPESLETSSFSCAQKFAATTKIEPRKKQRPDTFHWSLVV